MMNMWVSHSLGLISSLSIPLFSTASHEDLDSGDTVFKDDSSLCPFLLECGPFSHSLLHRKREACYSNSGSWVVDGWLSLLQLFHCLPLLLLSFLYPFHHLFQSSTLLVLLPCPTSLIFLVFMFRVFSSFSIFVIMFPSLTESSLPFIAYTFCVSLCLSLSLREWSTPTVGCAVNEMDGSWWFPVRNAGGSFILSSGYESHWCLGLLSMLDKELFWLLVQYPKFFPHFPHFWTNWYVLG